MSDEWIEIPLPRTTENDGYVLTELTNVMAVPHDTDSDKPYMLRSVPGIRSKVLTGSGAMRGAIAHGDYVWWVRGTQLRIWDGTTTTLVGTVSGTAFVQMVGCGANQIAIVDGTGNEYVASTSAVTAISPPAGNFSDITHQDGYTIAIRDGTDEFYISGLDDPTTWAALDFSTADAIADRGIGCYVHNRELHLFGEHHLEIWNNTGASPFPFQRQVPGVIDKGCRAPGSIANYGTSLFFLGRDFRVYRLEGYQPVAISNQIIEENIRRSFTSANAVRASCFVDRGKPCYALSISVGGAGLAFVYNIADGGWHVAFHTDASNTKIDYSDIVEFRLSTFELNIAAIYSASSANGFDHGIYTHSEANKQDQGSGSAVNRFITVSTGPLQLAGGRRVSEHELELTTKYQVGGASQVVSLFENGDAGAVIRNGDTITQAGGVYRWHRSGMARQRDYRFEISSDNLVHLHRLRARISVGT